MTTIEFDSEFRRLGLASRPLRNMLQVAGIGLQAPLERGFDCRL